MRARENRAKKSQETVWTFTGLIADTTDGFVSWSLTTYLPDIVFFYPLVKMAFTGWEVEILEIRS